MASESWLTFQIETSNSPEKIEDEVKSYLNEAKLIMANVKDDLWKDHEMYQRFQEEYSELRHTIKTSLDHGREFSKQERLSIMLELWDIVELANDQWVATSSSGFSYFTKNLLWADTNEALDTVESFLEKDISEYSLDESLAVLNHLNKQYWDYEDGSFALTDEENISDLSDKQDVNVYQERLISKILWENHKWFNQKYIQWFNISKWNYLKEIWEFEIEIRDKSLNINNINSNELAHYFWYLQSKWILNSNVIQNKFWSEKIQQFKQLINSAESDNRWFREIVSEYWLDRVLHEMKNVTLETMEIDSYNSINYNNLDNNTIKNNLSITLPNIDQSEKILDLLEQWVNIEFRYLHDKVIKDPKIIEKFDLTILDLNRYLLDDIADNKALLITLLNKDKTGKSFLPLLISKLQPKILESRTLQITVQNILDATKQSLPKATHDIIYWEKENLRNNELNDILQNIAKDSKNTAHINKFSEFLRTANLNSYQDQISDYIKNWWTLVWELFFNLTNEKIAKELLVRPDSYRFAHFLPADIYQKYSYLFEIVIDKTPVNEVSNFIRFVDFPDLESMMYTLENIQKRDPNEFKKFYNNEFVRQKIIDMIDWQREFKGTQSQINLMKKIDADIKSYNLYIKKLESTWKEFSEYIEAQNKISQHIENMSWEEKMSIIQKNLFNKLNLKGIEISEEKVWELTSLLLQPWTWSKKLFLEKINSYNFDAQQQETLIGIVTQKANYVISQRIEKNISWEDITPKLSRKQLVDEYQESWLWVDELLETKNLSHDEKKQAKEILDKHNKDIELQAEAISLKQCLYTDENGDIQIDEDKFHKKIEENKKNFNLDEFTQQYSVDAKLTEIFTQKYIEHKNLEFLEEINLIDTRENLSIHQSEEKTSYSYAWISYEINENNYDNSFSIVSYVTGEQIEISQQEKETIENNPEALKNLIDTKQKLEMLGLEYVWNNREEFLFLMKNDPNFNDTGKIEYADKDYLNISEFNHLLQFVLYKATGDTNTNDYFTNMSKIRQLNGENELNEKRNFISGLSNIWQKFVELWFLTQSGTLAFNWKSTKNYSDLQADSTQKVA